MTLLGLIIWDMGRKCDEIENGCDLIYDICDAYKGKYENNNEDESEEWDGDGDELNHHH